MRIKEWRKCYHQYLDLWESENKHKCYCWLFRNSMLMLLKENLKNTMMHSESDVMHCMKKWSNSTTRMLLLREKIVVRTQIYESQSSSENREQTRELFFNAIIKFSNENLSLREILLSILRSIKSTRIFIINFQRLWIYKNSSHIQTSMFHWW